MEEAGRTVARILTTLEPVVRGWGAHVSYASATEMDDGVERR
jgi:hypothetical protein